VKEKNANDEQEGTEKEEQQNDARQENVSARQTADAQ
jgi:hypothetical protein